MRQALDGKEPGQGTSHQLADRSSEALKFFSVDKEGSEGRDFTFTLSQRWGTYLRPLSDLSVTSPSPLSDLSRRGYGEVTERSERGDGEVTDS